MELFIRSFGDLPAFVYHCFDRIVIHGYLTGLSRPEHVAYFFREVVGAPMITKEILGERTNHYQSWAAPQSLYPYRIGREGPPQGGLCPPLATPHGTKNAYGVYFIFKSMEVGPSFRIPVPKYPTKDPNYRIVARQRSRFTHYYFYIRDDVLGPIVMGVGSFFPSRRHVTSTAIASLNTSETVWSGLGNRQARIRFVRPLPE